MNRDERSNRLIAVIAASLAVATVAAVLWGRATRGPFPSDPMSAAEQSSPLDGGAPTMRARIDEYIADVADEDTFEELAAGLNEREDRLIVVGINSNEPVPESMYETCLANRRLARMFGILKKRPPAEADAACRKLFEEKLAILRNDLLICFERLDKRGGPYLVELPFKEPIVPVHEDQIALSGALFLSAEFCPVEEVLRQLDQWIDLIRELMEEYDRMSTNWDQSDPAHKERIRLSKESLERDGLPQSRYQLNLLANMLERRFGIHPGGQDQREDLELLFHGTPEEQEAYRAQVEAALQDDSHPLPGHLWYVRMPFCAWDAATNPYDATHISRGVPVDAAGALGEYFVYKSWGYLVKAEHRERALNRLREELLAAAERADGDR